MAPNLSRIRPGGAGTAWPTWPAGCCWSGRSDRDGPRNRADATGLNYEVSYSRGIPAGEYTVNVHLYRNASKVYPVPITVVTSVVETRNTDMVAANEENLIQIGVGVHYANVAVGFLGDDHRLTRATHAPSRRRARSSPPAVHQTSEPMARASWMAGSSTVRRSSVPYSSSTKSWFAVNVP